MVMTMTGLIGVASVSATGERGNIFGFPVPPNHAMLATHSWLACGYGVKANKNSRNVYE